MNDIVFIVCAIMQFLCSLQLARIAMKNHRRAQKLEYVLRGTIRYIWLASDCNEVDQETSGMILDKMEENLDEWEVTDITTRRHK